MRSKRDPREVTVFALARWASPTSGVNREASIVAATERPQEVAERPVGHVRRLTPRHDVSGSKVDAWYLNDPLLAPLRTDPGFGPFISGVKAKADLIGVEFIRELPQH